MLDSLDAAAMTKREISVRRNPGTWQWILGPAILLAAVVVYSVARTNVQSGVADSEYAVLEYVRLDLPSQGLLDKPNWMVVEVFDSTTGTWEQRPKDQVKPGEEFRAIGLLFKQVSHDGLSEIHGEVDVKRLDDAYAGFDQEKTRNPTAVDVVYVLGQPLPKGGFQTVAFVGPNCSFRFQGRLFTTEPGSRADTVRVVETKTTFESAGGDPDAKAPQLLHTAYTDKFNLPPSASMEDDEQ